MEITLYQELFRLQELCVRLLCPALVKCLLIVTALDRAGVGVGGWVLCLSQLTDWKELEGEPRAAALHRV